MPAPTPARPAPPLLVVLRRAYALPTPTPARPAPPLLVVLRRAYALPAPTPARRAPPLLVVLRRAYALTAPTPGKAGASAPCGAPSSLRTSRSDAGEGRRLRSLWCSVEPTHFPLRRRGRPAPPLLVVLRRAYALGGPPERLPHAFLGRRARVGGGERALGVGGRVAELDERVARDDMIVPLDGRDRRDRHGRELLLQLEHDPLGGLLADAGDRLEARGVLAHDRAAQLLGRGTRHDRERHLRADTVHREELDEELALAPVGEAVELQRVLAHVQIRLDDDLVGAVGLPHRARRRRDEVADAADVEQEPLRRRADRHAAQARDHARSRSCFRSGFVQPTPAVSSVEPTLIRRASGAAATGHGRSRRRARRPHGSASAAPAARGSPSPSAAPVPSRRGRSRRPPA